MSNLVELNNINVSFKAQQILENISLTIKKGEFISLVGPNGAGKSTLLKIIIGSLKANSGTIKYAKKLKIGYVPQKFSADPNFPISVKDFIELAPSSTKLVTLNILKELDIENIKDKLIHELSGGELQKTLIARSLVGNPNLILLDEPDQNLDLKGQIAIYELIKKIHQERNCAIIMISHDLHLVMANTNNVICLYHHICCSGQPEKIKNDPKFNEIFGSDMNKLLAYYQHQHNHEHCN